MATYDKLSEWAAKHNMQFRVEVEDERVYLWMADAIDGYCGAECVCIEDGKPMWMCYRFRLRKNEEFLAKFMRFGTYEDTDWLGYHDPEPLFILPYYWRGEHGTWKGKHGFFYWLDKKPSTGNEWEMVSAGCEMLKSHPHYAPEIVSDVVFVPNGTPFMYYTQTFGTAWLGKETIGRYEEAMA